MQMLKGQEIALWQIDLDASHLDTLAASLNPMESDKAGRFHSLALQTRYRRSQGALRQIMSSYLDVPPAAVAFQHGAFGKPTLAGHALQFNLSHSGNTMLLAIARHSVGVDVEQCAETPVDLDPLLELLCHADERTAMAALAPNQRRQLFYPLWTRKEAYLKALGTGLSVDFRLVSFAPVDTGIWQGRHDGMPSSVPYYCRDLPHSDAAFCATVCSQQPQAPVSLHYLLAECGPFG
ncbi:4'-phosphopantetheinyl transferase family protein [Janthinobacterium lividum]|uniref:4'-phosphopantetheinyl transferase family protein n=1 Tax=Janthinobacterium lividum TaxID=29581 RepID=UPI000874B81F|nr:4'-phosphopantetheinyl transferase superfamily protein [Janthinobacterium lividum]OEZ49759.1 4'-phosphopantetheinyl transferase psf-1 [Janthinobacterium lividum]